MFERWKTGEHAPLWRLRYMFVCHFTQALFIVLPYTVSVYMVRDFLVAGAAPGQPVPEQRVGVLTGALGAVSSAAALLTSYPLGALSDRVGRKAVILVGLASSVASLLWYGAAPSLSQALAARALGGAFNGVIGAEKAMIGDCCDARAATRAFSLFSLAWGVGALFAPVLGGGLSRPCAGALAGATWACGDAGAPLRRWPYLLPCAVSAALCALALALCALGLEETLPGKCGDEGLGSGQASLNLSLASSVQLSVRREGGLDSVSLDWPADDRPGQGGLELQPSGLAPSNAFGGAVLILFTLLGLGPALRALGVLPVTRLGLWCVLPFAVLVPLASEAPPGRGVLLQATLFAGQALRSTSAATAFTGCLILVNAAAQRCGALGAYVPFAALALVAMLAQVLYLHVHLPLEGGGEERGAQDDAEAPPLRS
ncbi:putative peptide/nitrate transporter [Auxenochlorella protothecoides]|uniref:Putative peptide/nitrate transporter n=1 Tax=Auxenochlorella protothecoides TaxID=3075 RepID=A0A087SRK9_AUXPR|nr:putative peptide/nitrate transporter [Auxenochlorella protothecoides]KFM28363.1 putative peptide/nitrate transporter [Auxenochlorella protothecoides]